MFVILGSFALGSITLALFRIHHETGLRAARSFKQSRTAAATAGAR
jgi:hypothetical protein